MTWGRGSTRAWRTLRASILRRDPTCQLRYDCCTIVSTEVDHITNLASGGADHPANLQGACHQCHAEKTKREAQAGRAAGGRPAQQHPGII